MYILSSPVFNIYSGAIFQEALNRRNEGIIINGQVINNLRYADETILMTDSLESLQVLLQRVSNVGKEYELTMNLKKTKYMIITKKPNINSSLSVDETPVERVEQYKYLGTWLNQNVDQSQEVKARIEISRATFVKMKMFLCSGDINLKLRVRMLRCYVFSTLMYGAEAWTIKKAEIEWIAAFERWCCHRSCAFLGSIEGPTWNIEKNE